jgi:hypothetical protein
MPMMRGPPPPGPPRPLLLLLLPGGGLLLLYSAWAEGEMSVLTLQGRGGWVQFGLAVRWQCAGRCRRGAKTLCSCDSTRLRSQVGPERLTS